MRDPVLLAAALEAALVRLVERIGTLRESLAVSRAAFVRSSSGALEAKSREHAALAEQVHALEQDVASRRHDLCRALGRPVTARLGQLLGELPADHARRLEAAAQRLREGLHALRVESRVGQRLLDLSRRAQEGLVRGLPVTAGGAAHRYDRHARSVRARHAGGFLRGTV